MGNGYHPAPSLRNFLYRIQDRQSYLGLGLIGSDPIRNSVRRTILTGLGVITFKDCQHGRPLVVPDSGSHGYPWRLAIAIRNSFDYQIHTSIPAMTCGCCITTFSARMPATLRRAGGSQRRSRQLVRCYWDRKSKTIILSEPLPKVNRNAVVDARLAGLIITVPAPPWASRSKSAQPLAALHDLGGSGWPKSAAASAVAWCRCHSGNFMPRELVSRYEFKSIPWFIS